MLNITTEDRKFNQVCACSNGRCKPGDKNYICPSLDKTKKLKRLQKFYERKVPYEKGKKMFCFSSKYSLILVLALLGMIVFAALHFNLLSHWVFQQTAVQASANYELPKGTPVNIESWNISEVNYRH